jgi:energy-coupling factor transporter ATP-binding protein EcfA2
LSGEIAQMANLRHLRTVSENGSKTPQVAPPASTGNAGPQFENKVGAFYLLSLLVGSEPRGLPGATTRRVAFQQRGSGRPLDDVIIQATNADGSAATLEIQAKRTLTFTATDTEFKEVVAQIWAAAQKSEFGSSRYELAVAIARTTTRVEASCQEVLHWARQLPDGATFATHINLEGFSSKGMRDFVEVFRANLLAAGAPADDDTVWRGLRRFQILVFDFESYGSDYEHRARERARLALIPEQASRATELWPILIEQAGATARAGGALDRNAVLTPLREQHNFQFDQRADLHSVDARFCEAASRTLDDIKDQVGGVRLARTELVDQAYVELEERRILHIVGGPGVGKSAIMKHLAERLQPEGRIVVLGNGRIIPGGWIQMSHVVSCPVSQDELFNELGCGGGATLFIDNIDQIDDAGEWATVSDLLAGVAKCQGWRALVTGGVGNDEWKTKLPQGIRSSDIGTLEMPELGDDETATLSSQNLALAILLGAGHPARGIARNLFYLSRMVEFGASHAGPASAIATEIDLARLWWRYGGGRSEDAGGLARLKVLREMAVQFVANPHRIAFRTDDFDSPTIAELLRLDSLREDVIGAAVAFRHDVLRDWAVGFLLHEDREGDLLKTLPLDKPLPAGLARGIEIAARLAIESDATGARWVALLDALQGDNRHGSWQRPILLALPRAEQALALFESLKSVLLVNDGRLLCEILSVPVVKLIERVQPSVKVPPGVGDMVVAKGGITWAWLVTWLVSAAQSLPTALVPDVAKVFQAWLISTQNQSWPINPMIVQILFDWLALIESRMSPRFFRDPHEAPPSLNIPHPRDVRDEIRMIAFAFAHLNHAAAQNYLSHLNQADVTYHDTQDILRAPGTLARAAPAALADFVLGALIEEDDPDALYARRRNPYGPFSVHEHLFSPASPGQGPFFDLLESAPPEGLRLIRAIVEHATQMAARAIRRSA